ncbi:hypothetical protein FRX31_006998 [Thalictrum thalictroides]|uniref:Uncharacterized protein n=1 Tax=Thalictrum thalictroides TaxID=46969 RepID=A0A7J6X3E4_THATH|nr:hypothetical protein FRX31_006998 [Thalictrum thalictroides]
MERKSTEVFEIDNRLSDALKMYFLNPNDAEVGKNLKDMFIPSNPDDFKEIDDIRAHSINVLKMLRQNDLQNQVWEIYQLSNSVVVHELETRTLSILAKIASGQFDKAFEQVVNLSVTFLRSGFVVLFITVLACQLYGSDVSKGIVLLSSQFHFSTHNSQRWRTPRPQPQPALLPEEDLLFVDDILFENPEPLFDNPLLLDNPIPPKILKTLSEVINGLGPFLQLIQVPIQG